MAGSKSDYLENKILDLIWGNQAFSPPSTIYVALFTAAPNDAGGGTEVSGGSYARAAVQNNATNFPAASGGVKSNGTAINFPQATASWGTVVAVGFFDAATGGNLLAWADLTTSKAVGAGDTISFPIGGITITEE